MHSKAQAGEKRSERQPIHLLVLGVTALCFGALSEICWCIQSGRVGVCNAIIARWAEGGWLEGLTDPKPERIFSFFSCHQVSSTLTAIPILEPPSTSLKKSPAKLQVNVEISYYYSSGIVFLLQVQAPQNEQIWTAFLAVVCRHIHHFRTLTEE